MRAALVRRVNRRALVVGTLVVAALAAIATSLPEVYATDEAAGPRITLSEDSEPARFAVSVTASEEVAPEAGWTSHLCVRAVAESKRGGSGELALSLREEGVEVARASAPLTITRPAELEVCDRPAFAPCGGACTESWELVLEHSGDKSTAVSWSVEAAVRGDRAGVDQVPDDSLSIEITSKEE